MKILLVGGTGLIGSAVIKLLSKKHEVILATSSGKSGIKVDITNIDSIKNMYKEIGQIDAVACAASGNKLHFGDLLKSTEQNYQDSFEAKLLSQINLVHCGIEYINPNGGSFTLISGVVERDPIRGGTAAAMVVGGLHGFVNSAAIELPRHIRINCIAPTIITEAVEKFDGYFQGFKSVPVIDVANGYLKSIEGLQTGKIYKIE
jgi:NAD(P)-dependent dehydrogenase (short-subunit alcohol dehydrogenase family)